MKKLSLMEEDTYKLSVSAKDGSYLSGLVWESDNPEVVKVDSNGNLTVDPKLFRACSEIIGNHGGVYCFTTGSRRPLYVGKSSLLYSRIPASFATYIKEKDARIFYYCEDNNVDRTILEILLISEWKPKYNRVWKKQDGQRFKSGLTLNDFKEIKLSETPD